MKTVLSVCLFLLLFRVAEAKVLWECGTRSPAGVKFTGPWKTTPQGWRKTANAYRIDFTNLPPAKANTRLSYDIRCFERNTKSRGAQHFGLYGTAGSEARFCIRSLYGDCMTAAFTTPSGTSMQRGLRNPFEPKFKFPFDLTNPPVTHVEIDMRADSYALRLNGETVAYEKIAFPGVKELSYMQYAADCALDNFKIEEIEEEVSNLRLRLKTSSLSIPDDDQCVYPLATDAFSPQGGGFSYWLRMEPGPNRVSFKNAAGQELLSASFADVFLFVNVLQAKGGTWEFRRRLSGQCVGDWVHVAYTWRPDGTVRFFLNGLPYTPGFSSGERFGRNILGNGLSAPASVEVMNFKHPQARRDRIQGLKIYARPIENHEVSAEYRARMPIDAVLYDGLVEAGKPVSLTFSIAPAGYYTHPKPVDEPDRPGTADLKLVLKALKPQYGDGRNPTRITGYAAVSSVTQDFGRVTVDSPKTLALAPRVLEPGKYSLSLVVNDGAFVKTRTLDAGEMPDFLSVPATDGDWETVGEPLVVRRFTKTADMEFAKGVSEGALGGKKYLETTGTMQTVLAVPKDALGHPLLLEIAWPDDKTRYTGFYLYPEGKGQQRDRLQAGLLSGGEFKLTERFQRQQYLVFFQTTNELFEVRAMAKGMPGAIAALKVSRLKEPLPRLKVNLPKGMRGRAFGFADEDQTFYNNFQSGKPGTLGSAWELIRYFAYTGQNAMNQLFFRYTTTLCPMENTLEGMNMFPQHASELAALPGIFAKNGCELWAAVSVYNIPEANFFDLIESNRREQGFLFLDQDGLDRFFYNQGAFRPNIANPLVRAVFAKYVADYVNKYATNGVAAVAYDGIGSWPLDLGYDNWTVNRFLAETGTKLPKELKKDAVTIADYRTRSDWLTATNAPATVRTKWLRWRADRVTTWYAELAKAMTRTNPDLAIIFDAPGDADPYVSHGMDLAALAKIPNVRLGAPYLNFNNYRWLHFRGDAKAKDLKAGYAKLHDFAAEDSLGRSRRLYGAAAMTIVGGQYHETYGDTLCPQRFGTVFQDADVKPWGRNWLRELTYVVAKSDTLALFTGQQPLGTLGHERETREFARAYRALPAQPFADAKSDNPNVVVRTLKTKNGTYLYCVNLSDEPQTVRPELFRKKAYVDLSTGEKSRDAVVTLAPYALRSFLK